MFAKASIIARALRDEGFSVVNTADRYHDENRRGYFTREISYFSMFRSELDHLGEKPEYIVLLEQRKKNKSRTRMIGCISSSWLGCRYRPLRKDGARPESNRAAKVAKRERARIKY